MAITGEGYIKRSDFMTLADVGLAEAKEWELIGDKVEEMMLAMNPNVETVTDITGNTTTTLNKYEVQTDVTPMRAKKESKLAKWLYEVVKEEKTLSDVEKEFLCVNVFDESTTGVEPDIKTVYAAWTQKGVVAVQSYGGNSSGLDIPFNIHWIGKKTHGTFDPVTKTFTPTVA
jgi:CRISPR/Cas system-associated protein Cas5 (RAMP superfamily)